MSATAANSTSIRDEIVTLIGYRGCGKTVVGRQLAERLGWRFIDTDDVIEQQAGQTIREIFQAEGEPGWAALRTVLASRPPRPPPPRALEARGRRRRPPVFRVKVSRGPPWTGNR